MNHDNEVFQRMLEKSLTGKSAHVETAKILEGLDWKLAGQLPNGATHSVFQLVNHMIYWQEWVVRWLDGKKPKVPKHASGGWPGKASPVKRKEWELTAKRYLDMLEELLRRSQEMDLCSKRGQTTPMEMLHSIASHNSYHAGQVVILRQMIGAWPLPSGGVTW